MKDSFSVRNRLLVGAAVLIIVPLAAILFEAALFVTLVCLALEELWRVIRGQKEDQETDEAKRPVDPTEPKT